MATRTKKASTNGHAADTPLLDPLSNGDEAEATRPRKARNPRGMPGPKKGTLGDIPDIHQFVMKEDPYVWMRVLLIGTSELIVHKASAEVLQDIEDKLTGEPARAKGPIDPLQQALDGTHICKGRYDKKWIDKNLYGWPAVDRFSCHGPT